MNPQDKSVPDSQGHVLVPLWKDYYRFQKADQPVKELSILEKIREQAAAERLHWDFYVAATEAVNVGISVNWKNSDSLRNDLSRRISEYDEPLVTYCHMLDKGDRSRLDYVLSNESRLRAGRNPAFYAGLDIPDMPMASIVREQIKDDFEYCLWMELSETALYDKDSKVLAALEPLCKGRYPLEQYLEYRKLFYNTPYDSLIGSCRDFAEAHKGQAIRLLALGEYVTCLKDSLDRADAPSARYEELRSLCRTFEAERKGYHGASEGVIAAGVKTFESMIKALERKSIALDYEDDTIKVITRNIRSFSLSLMSDEKKPKSIFTTKMAHPEERFYVRDTFEVILPEINDGKYLVEVRAGDQKRRSEYRKHSLSIALRDDADGRSRIYVADSRTGEPVEKVNLELCRSGKQVSKVEDFVLDGFTPLPESFRDSSSDWYFGTIVASAVSRDGFLKTSPDAWINSRNTVVVPERKSVPALNIFTDKAAYRPGETIRYKAVLYLAGAGHAEAMGEGFPVKVLLRDSEGKEVDAARLATNEYGSVAGEFTLPEGLRGGRFRLDVSFSASGEYGPASASRSIVVDEFVLPNYEITFDSSDELYLAGDTVIVRGTVKSFTGHKVSAASASYEVRDYVRAVRSGTLELGDDGSFEFSFPSSEKGSVMHYSAFVRVTGATGETIENSKSVPVLSYLNPSVEILNSTGGQARVSYRDRADVRTVSGPEARVRISISNPDGMTVNLPVSYSLTDSAGKSIACGTGNSGEPFVLSLPASGAYSFKVNAEKTNQRGEKIAASRELTLLRFDDSAKTLESSFEHVFSLVGSCRDGVLEPGEDIHLKIGAGDGPAWMLVELFGDRKQLLEKRLVYLEGVAGSAGSVEDVIFSYKDEYPEGLCLNVFYFRKNRSYDFSRTFVRKREIPALPMSFTRFVDRALPDAGYEISLAAGVGVEALAAIFDKSSETISPNVWERSMKFVNGVERVFVHSWSGAISGADISGDDFDSEEAVVMGYGKPSRGRKLALKSAAVMEDRAVSAPAGLPGMRNSEEEGVEIMDYVEDESVFEETGPVRSDFSTSLAFEPFLRSDDSGNIKFGFRTSDKLSTFVVQVYAHDKSMRDTVIRKEFVVSLPVKLSLVQPEYLYRGDKLTLHAALNSLADKPVDGTVTLSLFDSGDFQSGKPFRKYSKKVTVPAGDALPLSFDLKAAEGDTLGILLSFTATGAESAGNFSDRLFVTVPVKDDSQVLTESHSAVLLPGTDREKILKQLRAQFTGTSSYGAEYSETDIRGMLLDAIPHKVDPEGKDVLSVTEAIYVRRVASNLGSEVPCEYSDAKLMNMLSSCRNADGGFGWFPGMK
ncbi:MAG: MG2 domain-containing protein, partial [Candidatus Cryptobacteroides sp.]